MILLIWSKGIKMNISFKGFKNVGSYMTTNKEQTEIKKGPHMIIFPKGKHIDLHAELNNTGTQDLDDFKVILKAFPNRLNRNSLNITYDEYIHPDTKKKERIFALNNSIIDVNETTFPVFNKVFKLLEKIKNAPKEELKVDNSYVLSAESQDAFNYYFHLDGMDCEKFCRLLDEANSTYSAKEGSTRLSRRLKEMLTEYIYQD